MKMLILLWLLSSTNWPPVRPPEPTVPFPYDPNQVQYEILDARREYPFTNRNITFRRVVKDEDGDSNITLKCSLPSMVIEPPSLSIDPNDPAGIGIKAEFICYIPGPVQQGLYYIDWETCDNDPNEPMYDRRTTVLYVWPKNKPPILIK